MSDHEQPAVPPSAPEPHPKLRDLDVLEGEQHEGTEYIGYDSAADSLRSMLFSPEGPGPFCSFALEYFWDITGDELTIWHGYKDSPARFTGTIDRDAGVVQGRWEWPGGGYDATATRIG